MPLRFPRRAGGRGRDGARRVVVVTGAAGRVGRACLRALDGTGATVVAVDRVRGDGPGRWRRADLRDPGEARRALAGATHLIHLAGVTAPDPALGSRVLTENLAIATSVLDAFAKERPSTAVLASSTSVYGLVWSPTVLSPEYVPVDEAHPCRPSDPYSLSKLAVESLAAMWARSAGFTTVCLRFPWAAGDDEPDRVRAFLGRMAENPIGELGRRHLWTGLHIDDVADAIVRALDLADGSAHVLTVCAPQIPEGRSASELIRQCHPTARVVDDVDVIGLFSTVRARQLLGWQPSRTLVPSGAFMGETSAR